MVNKIVMDKNHGILKINIRPAQADRFRDAASRSKQKGENRQPVVGLRRIFDKIKEGGFFYNKVMFYPWGQE